MCAVQTDPRLQASVAREPGNGRSTTVHRGASRPSPRSGRPSSSAGAPRRAVAVRLPASLAGDVGRPLPRLGRPPTLLAIVLLRRHRQAHTQRAGRPDRAVGHRRPPARVLPDDPRRRQARADLRLARPLPSQRARARRASPIIASEPEALPPHPGQGRLADDAARAERPVARDGHRACAPASARTCRAASSPTARPCAARSTTSLTLAADPPRLLHPVQRRPQDAGPGAHAAAAERQAWTEERRQLAQTYVNTASSSLITLHHLAEAEKQSMTDGADRPVQPPVDGQLCSSAKSRWPSGTGSRCRSS